ncbi:dual specificity tyrosine-phosphorylation regulated kinase [Histoplasma capsulatum var. duboisii H88]|uniref:Dual specificity tyrosine-phosphorylation regulated kinase n=1 Tax=Ajellomyces capsulatus (strain H88) TaxID=544711 RepID=F0UPL1_AJEC8|nr:dual specificity tyrosine-phosphorylation regulated kinase [Histoplasma capsulatum var. duboisii H88]
MPLQKSMPQRTPQSKSSNLPPHTDDSGSGGRHLLVQQKSSASAKTQAAKTNRQVQAVEGPPSRRMQKNSSSGSITTDSSNSSSLPFRNNTEQRAGGAPTRRRQSIREQNTTIGPRNGDPVKRAFTNYSNPQTYSENPSTQPSTSLEHTGNSSSRLSFGSATAGGSLKDESPTPPDNSEFLAPISFDDFHNSIMSKEPSLSHFPLPMASSYDLKPPAPRSTPRWSSQQPPQNGNHVRTTQLARRESNASRSTVGSATGVNGNTQPQGTTVSRPRRLSHAPPPSSTVTTSRPPRKSIGPGSLISDGDRVAPRRRPSLSARKASDANRSDQPNFNPQNFDVGGPSESKMFLNTPRYQKAKSLQPPSRIARDSRDSLFVPSTGPEPLRSSSNNAVRTPAKTGLNRTTTPSSSKRISVMPPHAHGLGARTISPTDARRMKRMSLMPQPPPMPHTPPTQQNIVLPRPRSSVQSPSMIPRKSVTPSSSRTTPDPHRKSYSSGISLSSNTSYNSARNSNGSLQPRLSQNISTSRLPTPKPRADNASNNDEEEVPPVPAIPKAYESPKTEGEVQFPPARKSSLPSETGSLGDSLKLDSGSFETPSKGPTLDDFHVARPVVHRMESKPRPVSNIGRKNLQPLKLPPLNLLPLSVPMTNKIESLRDKATEDATSHVSRTPPPRQIMTKTPTTPMTASKASFFSHSIHDQEPLPSTQLRSTSSHHALLTDPIRFRAQNSSSALEPLDILSDHRSISPYISSSLPKAGGEFSHVRPQLPSEYSRNNASRLTGPRPQTQFATISPRLEASSLGPQTADTESESSAPSFTRRNPSLDHQRTKSHHTIKEPSNNSSKYGNMPPPKLPASATWNGLSTVGQNTGSTKPTYLHSRRKASTSSVTNGLAQRTQSISSDQSLVLNPSPSTDAGDIDSQPNRSTSSLLSPVHKLLSSSKSTTPKLRLQDQNLDRDDLLAEEEMKRLGSKRKDFETAAKELEELRRRASPKERVGPGQALKMASLNIFEKGEIIDFKDIYFCGTHKAKKHVGDLSAQAANFGYDDERGDYNIVIGDHLAYRYEIVDILGKGSFGQVVRCVDHKTGSLVAVKIIRNKKRFHQQALVEVNILQKLKEWDPHRRHSVVNFTQSFYFRGHLCISTELLGMNLYEFIKAHDFRGFSLKLIRRFTKQLLSTLVLLHKNKVIHCDLKPENVLLAHPLHSEIKVIDFGSSCFENEKVYTYIQSRFYRSPEVILGMSYGMPIDMWSVGCILAELFTGYPIFPGENEQEQLACIMEVFGPPEKHLIEKSTRRKLFFDSLGKPRLTVSSKGRRRRPSSKDLRQVLKCDDDAFLDFITRCLRWDPTRRLTPNDALNHEFITGIKSTTRSRGHLPPINSPGKRITSGPASSTIRPLPNPPSLSSKGAGRPRDMPSQSPIKGTGPKRSSATTNVSAANSTTKRTSNGNPISGSALPRVTRATSGKTDLATAAAATSLKAR